MAGVATRQTGTIRGMSTTYTGNRLHAGPSTFATATSVPTGIFLLYCYFLVDFFLHLAARIPGYGSFRPTLLLVALLTLALLTQGDKLRERARHPVVMAVWILIGYILLSLPLVEWPGSVLRSNIDVFVKGVVFLFFTAFIIDTDRRLRIFVTLWLSLQVVRILEPLYLNLTEGYWGSSTHVGMGQFADRLAGAPADVINANELGFVIVTAIPFLHFLLGGSTRWSAKLLYFSLLPVLLYALVLTSSRGAMIAGLVMAWMVFKESHHKLLILICGIGIAVGGWAQMSDFQKERYLSLVDEDSQQHGTVDGRLQGMLYEFRLGFNKPVFGHGVGTTPEIKANIGSGGTQAAHNLYAEVLMEVGILGFIIFMTYLLRIYRLVVGNLRRMKELASDPAVRTSFDYRLNKALITTFWMYVVYSINYWGLSQSYWYLFGGLCVAYSLALSRREHRQNEPRESAVRPLGRPASG